jgi:hypothetical protein
MELYCADVGFTGPVPAPRMPCAEPCAVLSTEGYRRQGTIWNLSTRGVYAAMRPPLPELGDLLLLRFTLPGQLEPLVSCLATVQWRNHATRMDGRDAVDGGLPPGCGLAFHALPAAVEARIDALVAACWQDGPPVRARALRS